MNQIYITLAQLLMILMPIFLAFFFYVLRIERALVRISTELKNLKQAIEP